MPAPLLHRRICHSKLVVEQPDTPESNLGLAPSSETAPRALCVSGSGFTTLGELKFSWPGVRGLGDLSSSSWLGVKGRADGPPVEAGGWVGGGSELLVH